MFRFRLYKHVVLRHHHHHHISTTTVPPPATTTTHHFNLWNDVPNHHNPHLKSIYGIPENLIIPPLFTTAAEISDSASSPFNNHSGLTATLIARLFSKRSRLTSPMRLTLAEKYLLNTCGLPTEKAFSAAYKINLTTTDNPDLVISFLKNHGFNKTQIAHLIYKYPMLLQYDPYSHIKPKLDLFLNLGATHSEVANFFTTNPKYLKGWFQEHIISCLDSLKSFIDDNAAIMTILKRWPKIIMYGLDIIVPRRIATFRDHGVPDSNVIKLLISSPKTVALTCDRFEEITEILVKKIGIDPLSPRFVSAFRTVAGMSKSCLEKKLRVIQDELGWSKDDVLSLITKNPKLLTLSLEKRIIPRCEVLEILKSKGLISEKLNVSTILKVPEKEFMEKFVIKYQEDVPQVIEADGGGSEFVGSL